MQIRSRVTRSNRKHSMISIASNLGLQICYLVGSLILEMAQTTARARKVAWSKCPPQIPSMQACTRHDGAWAAKDVGENLQKLKHYNHQHIITDCNIDFRQRVKRGEWEIPNCRRQHVFNFASNAFIQEIEWQQSDCQFRNSRSTFFPCIKHVHITSSYNMLSSRRCQIMSVHVQSWLELRNLTMVDPHQLCRPHALAHENCEHCRCAAGLIETKVVWQHTPSNSIFTSSDMFSMISYRADTN